MDELLNAYRGCLLGMAIGDAMGFPIDELGWEDIQNQYGPNGLLGYDLQEQEFAQVSSYTQIAAFFCNGLLLSISRRRPDHLQYGKLALREWTRSQQFYRDPEPSLCWLAKLSPFRRHHCRDARMLDHLRLGIYSSVDSAKNHSNAPGALTAAVSVGLFFNPQRLAPEQIGVLTTELIGLTHGDPEAFLSGAALAYAIAGILQEPALPLQEQFLQAIAVMDGQFRSRFPQSEDLAAQLRRAISLAQAGTVSAQEGMEQLGCTDSAQCLAGAIFACLRYPDDFDSAITTAVNHSGMSAAVGAITGAVLGAKGKDFSLPEFYLESLECTQPLEILAEDLLCGSPAAGIFDDSWDHKYVQGQPPEELTIDNGQ